MFFRFGLWPGSSVCRATVTLITVVTATCCAHVAAAADVLTLGDAERLALEAEPGRAALESRAEAAEHRAAAADALPMPRLRVGLNNYPIQSGDFSTEGMTNASLGIRQTFPPGDSRRLEAEHLAWQATALSESVDLRTRAVQRAAREAWLSVHYWQEAAVQVRATRPFFEDLVTTTQSLYAVGRKTQQDVLRAELELSRLEDRLIDMASEEAVARARLSEWIGEAASLPVSATLPAWDRVPAAADMVEGLDDHPGLRVASADIESSRAAVLLATERKKAGWALDVGYAYRDGELSPGVDRSDFITVGVTVDLPFTRGKSIDSALTAALRDRSAAEHDRARERRSLESALLAEHARYTELSRRRALFEDRILAQVRAHAAAALDAYRSDTADFADVMRAYIDDLDTRTEFLRLSTERAKSFAALAYLGGL
jgi:outer membrane protein TolC